jgi:hypothetical protein
MNDDDIWQAYAKSVKKISDKRKSPSRSREGLGEGEKREPMSRSPSSKN